MTSAVPIRYIQQAKSRCLILFFVLFFFGCSSPCVQWQMVSIHADCPCTTYQRIHSKSRSPFNGLEAEVVYDGELCRMYLNACTLLLPADPENPEYTTVNLTIEEQTYAYSCVLFQGSQRTELPIEAQELVIDSLLQGNCVEVTIGRYQETLTPDNFPCLYAQLI